MSKNGNGNGKSVMKKERTLPANILEQDAVGGLEGISHDDLATPRLKILMQLSPELESNEKARAGMIFNTVTGEVYSGKEGILVLPCSFQRQYVEWEERGQGSGAPVNVYGADSDILQKVTRDQSNKDRLENGNYVETCANHFVLLLDKETKSGSPALITMKSTQLKKSRRWNSMMLNLKIQGSNGPFTPASYSHIYKLSVDKEKNDLGSWFGWNIERIKPLTDQNVYALAKEFAESVKTGSVKAKPEVEDSASGSKITPF